MLRRNVYIVLLLLGCLGAQQANTAKSKLSTKKIKENPDADSPAPNLETFSQESGIDLPESSESESASDNEEESSDSDSLMDMSLEELMNVELSSASLTETTRRLTPAAVTTINQEDIRASGARNLYELLEIFVPNFQVIRQAYEIRHMGLRGILHDRDDKYLLLVNGRIMNDRTHLGVVSERDLPMLTDIHHIDVVRGPASALYGPGALAMTISIVTYNAMTFEGIETTARIGAIEEHYTGEFKYGKKFAEDQGLFLYAGISKYLGSDSDDSPIVYPSVRNKNGEITRVGEPSSHHAWRDNQAFRDLPKLKLYGQYTHGNFDIWTRYTRGGEHHEEVSRDAKGDYKGAGYQQGTVYTKYLQEINSKFSLEYVFSYDTFDFEKYKDEANYREDEYFTRILARWRPHENHSIALGGEWSHEEFGLKGYGFPNTDPKMNHDIAYDGGLKNIRPWTSDMYSLFGEYQYNITSWLTTFVSARLDDHSMVNKTMCSPRGVVVLTPTEKDTIKLMASRSVRTNLAEDMKGIEESRGEKSESEELTAYELRYERQQSQKLFLAGSYFLHDHDLLGWASGIRPLGKMKSWGLELEANYRSDKLRVNLSHSYTKMLDYQPTEYGDGTFLTAGHHPGVDNDLANWSNNCTKLMTSYQLTNKCRLDGSVRINWGYPGGKDYAEYRNVTSVVNGYDKPYGEEVRLNLGLEYEINENLIIRADAYNILGWCDIDYNKRRYLSHTPGYYRCEAPSLGFLVTYRF